MNDGHYDGSRAINEKPLQESPPAELSFLLQSLFGLDHYPNYLHKWTVNDIEHLETLLQTQVSTCDLQQQQVNELVIGCINFFDGNGFEQIDKVKEEKSKVVQRNEVMKLYTPVCATKKHTYSIYATQTQKKKQIIVYAGLPRVLECSRLSTGTTSSGGLVESG